MNKNLSQRVDYIFSFFKGCKAGEGLFLYRTMSGVARKSGIPQDEINILERIAWDMCINDFLSYSDHFFKLTAKGFVYMNKDADDEFEFEPHLSKLVVYDKGVERMYAELWSLVGKENIAPYYASGDTLFGAFRLYNNTLPDTYDAFIESRRANKLSTSRAQWAYELLQSIPQEVWERFLISLSELISVAMNQRSAVASHPIPVNQVKEDTKIFDKNKTVFVSYSHDTVDHEQWVKKLVKDLRKHFIVYCDQDIPLGADITKFMEKIHEANKVLIIITPIYAQKANKRERGVGYESQIITADLYKDMDTTKFIPILREGSFEDNHIVYLGMRKGLDMTQNDEYNENLKVLIDNI